MSTDGHNQDSFENEDDDSLLNDQEHLAQKCIRLEAQVSALKEVSSLRKGLLDLREAEVKDLIGKLKLFEDVIEKEKETRRDLSIRVESTEQKCLELTTSLKENLENLSVMKGNYEDKINQLSRELEKSDDDYQKRTDELNDSELRNIDLQTRVDEANKTICENATTIKKLKEEMQVVAERNRVFSYQMNLLNTLFSETEGTPIDFDRIRAIGDIVRESTNNQNGPLSLQPPAEDVNGQSSLASPSQNPSHSRRASLDLSSIIDHIDSDTRFTEDIPGEESCYKKVTTVHGPQLVLSVSQTFIKLKDLILEKKSLQREIESLKHLNSKLESKVDKQERRLFTVTSELNKTWNLVAKLKVQHDKLHNSEAVLKYELHEKRKILERLKYELSRSRQQFAKVREKNAESELECKRMRAEFARRRQASSPASQESGAFSEASMSPCSSSDVDCENEHDEDDPKSRRHQNNPIANTIVGIDPENDEDEEEGVENEIDVDPLEELVSDLVEEIEAVTSIDNQNSTDGPNADGDDDDVFHTQRANRLRRLEDASRVLYSRLMATTVQSSALASRLAELHLHYGSQADEPEAEVFENYDELTVETESSLDVAHASQNPQNLSSTNTDDTEIESQFEDTVPTNTSITLANTVVGSIELLPGDEDVDDDIDLTLLPSLNPEFQRRQALLMADDYDYDFDHRHRRTSLHNIDNILMMDNSPEALIVDVEMESPEILAELAISRVDNQSPLLVLSTSTPTPNGSHPVPASGSNTNTNFSNSINNYNTATENPSRSDDNSRFHLDGDHQEQDDEVAETVNNNDDHHTSSNSSTSSPDLFSRLIQQVPKRLEILKQQNSSMKDKEQLLKVEMEKQKLRMESLEQENEKISQRLNEEIESKQNAISSLHTQIDDLVQTLNREKENLGKFMKVYLDEKADIESKDQPSTSSASSSSSSSKKCRKCEKTFSLLRRRKHHCATCKHAFCRDCTIESKTTKAKKERICEKCQQRKSILETTAQSFL